MLKLKFSRLTDNFNYFLILFLVVGYSLSPKLFSKININFGIPLYTTELIIFFIIVLLLSKVFLNDGKLVMAAPLRLEFMLFYLIFLISIFTGLFLYKDFAFVLRQSALFYYSIFYFLIILTFSEIDNLLKLKVIFWLFFISTNLMAFKYFVSIFGVNFFNIIGVRIEGMGGSGYFYISLLLILEIVFLMYMKKNVFTAIFFIDIVFLMAVNILYSVRGSWVATVVAVIFLWIFIGITPGLRRVFNNFNVVLLSSVLIIIFLGFFVYIYQIGSSNNLFIQIKREFLSIFDVILGNISSPNTQTRWRLNANVNTMWRLVIWKEMFGNILMKPVFGFGFGSKFLSSNAAILGWSTGISVGWVESHNYFLSFLFRNGFLGLGSFILIFVNFFRYVFKFFRNCEEERIKIIIIGLISCLIYILTLGLFEVVLEVPYMGSFLWIIMGFVIVIINYYNKQSSTIQKDKN